MYNFLKKSGIKRLISSRWTLICWRIWLCVTIATAMKSFNRSVRCLSAESMTPTAESISVRRGLHGETYIKSAVL